MRYLIVLLLVFVALGCSQKIENKIKIPESDYTEYEDHIEVDPKWKPPEDWGAVEYKNKDGKVLPIIWR